jgi:hypothetical protein
LGSIDFTELLWDVLDQYCIFPRYEPPGETRWARQWLSVGYIGRATGLHHFDSHDFGESLFISSRNAEVDLVQACLYIYFSDSAATKSALGAINGLGQIVACSVRIFAPLLTFSLFSVTHQHNLLGGTMVYWILWVFVIAGMYASCHLPKHLKSQAE